jgi:hypothetical protein
VDRKAVAHLFGVIRTPGVFQQLAPSENPTGIFHQLPQNHKLLSRQMHWGPPDHHPVPVKLKLHIANFQDP